jgi:cell volume regulation protein A
MLMDAGLLPMIATSPAGGTNVAVIPLQAQLLFIGVLYLGTLAISRFSLKFGIPAILGVLLFGLSINIAYVDITHDQAENFHLLVLALLLFYAGLKTDLKAIRGFLEYGILLAIGGVVVSSVLLGGIIWFLSSANAAEISFGTTNAMPLAAACLGSTDAGATLSVLRSVRHRVPQRLRHLLEFESSVNDPSALLFYGLILGIFVVSGRGGDMPSLQVTVLMQFKNFVQQVAAGLLVGFVFGYLARFIINYLVQERSQLLIVAISIAFIVYGSASFMGGSGLIAIYVTALFLTNTSYRSPEINHISLQEVLLPFNTMTEISVFLVFGLLVDPADLVEALPVGIFTALGLMLLARPLSVLLFQPFSPFSLRESLLISWCGLRGAVPLALSYDLVTSIPNIRGIDPDLVSRLAQNSQSIIFTVVVLNLFLQGITLPGFCRVLGLEPDPAEAQAPSP